MKTKLYKIGISIISGLVVAAAVTTTPYLVVNNDSHFSISNQAQPILPSFNTSRLVVNSTWNNDKWADTEGYYYMAMQRALLYNNQSWQIKAGKWPFKLDNTGFFTSPVSVPYSMSGAYTWDRDYSRDLTAARFNPSPKSPNLGVEAYGYKNNEFTKVNSFLYPMQFFADTPKVLPVTKLTLAPEQSFIKLNVPSLFVNLTLHVDEIYNTVTPKKQTIIKGENESHTSGKIIKNAASDDTDILPYNWGITLSDSAYNSGSASNSYFIPIPGDPAEALYAGTSTVEIIANLAYENIYVFNDYDSANANANKGTHMQGNGSGFSTTLNSLTIDTTTFDFNKRVSTQLEKIEASTTIAGNDLAYNFVRSGNLTVSVNELLGEATINFKPKWIFANGIITPNTSLQISKTISGFQKSKTIIVANPSYPTNIVVDKWRKKVANSSGQVTDRAELAKYLDISTVPSTANLTLVFDEDLNNVYNYQLGEVYFRIYADQLFTIDDVLLNEKTYEFPIALTLAPRITTFTINNTNPDKLAVDELYTKLFYADGEINQSELIKYGSFYSAIDAAKYYLVPNSYKTQTGDGTVSFQFYASKYYDSKGIENSGNINDSKTHFSINLTLYPLASMISAKNVDKPVHLVNKFIGLVADINGNVTNLNLLEQYVDLENVPSGAAYKINLSSVQYDKYNADYYYEGVNFDLSISKYNERDPTTESGIIQVNKTIPLRLKLGSVHLQTTIQAKPAEAYDSSIRLDHMLSKIVDSNNVVINRPLLERYVDIKYLPQASILKIDNIKQTDATGVLNFDIIPSVAYGADSLQLNNHPFPIELQLTKRYQPTTIIGNTAIVDPERVDRFAQTVQSLTSSSDLINYLSPKYIKISGDSPIDSSKIQYKLSNLKFVDSGTLSFDLLVSDFYNSDAEIAKNGTFHISLNLSKKPAPTSITVSSHYPQGSTIRQYLDKVKLYKNNQIEIRKFLGLFLNGLDTIPDGAIVEYFDLTNDPYKGEVNFYLTTSVYYNASGDYVPDTYTSSPLKLQFIPNDLIDTISTTVKWIDGVTYSAGDAKDFFNQVSPEGKTDFAALSQYIQITNLPLETVITIINKDPDFINPRVLQFDLKINGWWEAGVLKPTSVGDVEQTKIFNFEMNIALSPSDGNYIFPWWWIILALVLLGILILIFINARRRSQANGGMIATNGPSGYNNNPRSNRTHNKLFGHAGNIFRTNNHNDFSDDFSDSKFKHKTTQRNSRFFSSNSKFRKESSNSFFDNRNSVSPNTSSKPSPRNNRALLRRVTGIFAHMSSDRDFKSAEKYVGGMIARPIKNTPNLETPSFKQKISNIFAHSKINHKPSVAVHYGDANVNTNSSRNSPPRDKTPLKQKFTAVFSHHKTNSKPKYSERYVEGFVENQDNRREKIHLPLKHKMGNIFGHFDKKHKQSMTNQYGADFINQNPRDTNDNNRFSNWNSGNIFSHFNRKHKPGITNQYGEDFINQSSQGTNNSNHFSSPKIGNIFSHFNRTHKPGTTNQYGEDFINQSPQEANDSNHFQHQKIGNIFSHFNRKYKPSITNQYGEDFINQSSQGTNNSNHFSSPKIGNIFSHFNRKYKPSITNQYGEDFIDQSPQDVHDSNHSHRQNVGNLFQRGEHKQNADGNAFKNYRNKSLHYSARRNFAEVIFNARTGRRNPDVKPHKNAILSNSNTAGDSHDQYQRVDNTHPSLDGNLSARNSNPQNASNYDDYNKSDKNSEDRNSRDNFTA